MKVTFTWEAAEGAMSPQCTSESLNKDGINLLSCLLMDDGGIPYLQSIPWVREGIKRTDFVLSGELESSSWDRESWGVESTVEGAKIYSLYDDDYIEVVSLQKFKKALLSWLSFIESDPRLGGRTVIEL